MSDQLKIAILTTARSDFGPLKRVILHACKRFNVDIIVSGSHFLRSRGSTINEIKNEFFFNTAFKLVCFDSMDENHSSFGQIKTLSRTQSLAADWFASNRYDMLLYLGDRWELWGVTIPAFLSGIPLAHISGGEITEGVIDDCVRHSHTKISALHFAATRECAKNISLMGEEDWRISVVGECGLDLIHDLEFSDANEIQDFLEIDAGDNIILVTYHPSTLDFMFSVYDQISTLLSALSHFSFCKIVFTAPGAEDGAMLIIHSIQNFVENNSNAIFVDHLGSRKYLGLMRRAKVVVGNSSSGLIEAASFGVPAVNVGSRQKNRSSSDSVLHVDYNSEHIANAINKAMSLDHQEFSRNCPNPYDPFHDGKNSLRIINVLENALTSFSREHLLVKKFDNTININQWNSLVKYGEKF